PDLAGETVAFAARQGVARVAGVVQRVVHTLQEDTLLGVHGLGLARRDVEEERVEVIRLLDEGPPFRVGAVASARLGVVVGGVVPAVGRDLGHAVASATDVGPELLDAVGLRVAPGETDDGDVRALVAGVGAVLAGREDGLEGGLPLGGGRGSREWPRLGAPR